MSVPSPLWAFCIVYQGMACQKFSLPKIQLHIRRVSIAGSRQKTTNRLEGLLMASLPTPIAIEKFHALELANLREDLLQAGLDSRQVAELIRGFLTERGYGISFDDARSAASDNEVRFGSLQRMQETLERVAVLM